MRDDYSWLVLAALIVVMVGLMSLVIPTMALLNILERRQRRNQMALKSDNGNDEE